MFSVWYMRCGTTGHSSVSNKRSTVILVRMASQFALLFLVFVSPPARGQEALRSKSAAARQPLEIRLVRPPSWHDHYLEITIKRVNHSNSRIFLARVEMYSSVTRAKSTVELRGQGDWILVYGWTDVIESEDEERTLAPESEEQNTYYIGEAFPSEDMVTNTTRQVRVRGRLRILASYAQRVPKREIKGRQQKVEKRRTSAALLQLQYFQVNTTNGSYCRRHQFCRFLRN